MKSSASRLRVTSASLAYLGVTRRTDDERAAVAISYFFVMFIGLLFSWQRPEWRRDLRFE